MTAPADWGTRYDEAVNAGRVSALRAATRVDRHGEPSLCIVQGQHLLGGVVDAYPDGLRRKACNGCTDTFVVAPYVTRIPAVVA